MHATCRDWPRGLNQLRNTCYSSSLLQICYSYLWQCTSSLLVFCSTYTHYILDVSNSTYHPSTWGLCEHWPHRIVYTIFHDACPSCGSACEPQSCPSMCYHPDHCLQLNGIAFGPMLVVRLTLLTSLHSILSPSTMTIRPPHSASPCITSFILSPNALITFAESTIPEVMLV